MGERKTLISMIPGFGDVSPSPKTNYIYVSRHQDTQTTIKKKPWNISKNIVLINLKIWKSNTLPILEKTGAEKSRRSV